MNIRGSVRRKSKDIFQKVITLRKQGCSYGEIGKETGVAKTTINNWITFAGLNLSQKHLQIQNRKRLENHILGTIASKITRAKRKREAIENFLQKMKVYYNDPFFVGGVMLYEAEGTKGKNNGFSNSDYRLIFVFIKFLEKYLQIDKNKDLTFRLYIHETRKKDLTRIKTFWSKKLLVKTEVFKVSWKYNIVSKSRENMNYVGQMEIRVRRQHYLASKILAVSDIILSKYSRIGIT